MKQSTLKAILSKIQHALFLCCFFFNESSKSLESKEHSIHTDAALQGNQVNKTKAPHSDDSHWFHPAKPRKTPLLDAR